MIYFEDFLKYLKSANYDFLFLDEYFALRNDSAVKNKKMICLTFDDGYLDNYVFVYPLLKKYKAKGTIFVSPEYVQDSRPIRPTLEDVWSGKISQNELHTLGFLSWDEMLLMENSGVINIQSHTMTHTKYFVSGRIREFHHPHADYLYPISNIFPEKKPNYITDTEFNKLIPFGAPFFEEKSALIARKVTINPLFQEECVALLNSTNWDNYQFSHCIKVIKTLYEKYQSEDNLISHIETQKEYEARVIWEIRSSKRILEKRLKTKINHICWPHGDYNDFCHQTARDEGYQSSHIVLKTWEKNNLEDRFDRTGSGIIKQNRFFTLWKARYKVGAYRNVCPYNWIWFFYSNIVYGTKKN